MLSPLDVAEASAATAVPVRSAPVAVTAAPRSLISPVRYEPETVQLYSKYTLFETYELMEEREDDGMSVGFKNACVYVDVGPKAEYRVSWVTIEAAVGVTPNGTSTG